MSIMTRLKRAAEAYRADYSAWDTLQALIKEGKSTAGVDVNAKTALTLSAAYNAQIITSETMSTVPLQVFRRSSEGRQLYADHQLYDILHNQANPVESAQTFRQRFVWDLELHGIGLAEKIRDRSGRLKQLWHIPSDELSEVKLDGDKLLFHIGNKWMDSDKVFYCYGPGQDGLSPLSRLKKMNEALGLGLAANEFGARFFSNGTHLGGFIEHPKTLKDEQFKRLKASINEKYSGLGNANKVILLEDGTKFTPTGNTNESSQFLETRQFQIGEVARFYNIPPHLIGDLSKSTFSNIEHQGIEAVRYSWRPRAVRLESAINTQLVPFSERKTVYVEHNLDGLKQGDFNSQMSGWHLAIQDGVFNSDEVRAMLNMNAQPGGQGEIYFMPSNMFNKQDVKDGLTLKSSENTRKSSVFDHILRNEPNIDKFRAFAYSLIEEFNDTYKMRFSVDEYTKNVEKLLKQLENRSKTGFAGNEAARMRNAFRYAGLQASGVKKVVWRSDPDCPHCQHLNGQTREIGETFVDGIRHAPLTDGCNCSIEEAKE